MTNLQQNHFDIVRVSLAFIVVLGHLSSLTQSPELTFFSSIFNSDFAVKGFFSISGFLVTKSYLSNNNISTYANKRFRRIYPAYIVCILFCILLGACCTTLSLAEFVTHYATLKYLISNAIFLNFLQPNLPFVFNDNPISSLNGSLWTIKIEIMLYCFVPIINICYNFIGYVKTAIIFFILSISWVYFFTYIYQDTLSPEIARQFPGQLSYFILGSLFYVNTKILKNIKWIFLISMFLLFVIQNPYLKLIFDPICYCSIVLYFSLGFSFRNSFLLSRTRFNIGSKIIFRKCGDLSYGIYLYHFPIIQTLIFAKYFEINIWLGVFLTIFLTLIAASLSWNILEKKIINK